MLYYLLAGATFGFSAAVTPGPFQAFLLSHTVKVGWRKALPAAFAPLISDGPIIILMLFILSQTPDLLLTGLEIIGGFLLLYLAYESFKNLRGESKELTLDTESQAGVLKAALINASSPLPYIWWATVAGPLFLEGWRETPLNGTTFLVGFYGTLIAGFTGFILLFASANRIDPRLNRVLLGIATLGLFTFGAIQLYQGFSSFLG